MRINTRELGWWLDLKEVFQTLEMWRKLISRRRDSSRSFDGDSFDARSQRHKHTLCRRTEHRNLHTRKPSFSSERSKGLAETIGNRFHDSSACEDEAFSGGGTNGSEPAGSELHHDGDDDAVKCGFGATRQDVCLVGPAFLHPRAEEKKPLSHFQIFFYAQLSEWNMTRWRDGI